MPAALPGLLKAFRMTEKAAAVGFDWRKPGDVMVKMREEMDELEHELDEWRRRRPSGRATRWATCSLSWPTWPAISASSPRPPCSGPTRPSNAASRAWRRWPEAAARTSVELSLEEQDALWEEAKTLEGNPSRRLARGNASHHRGAESSHRRKHEDTKTPSVTKTSQLRADHSELQGPLTS